jgi:sterol desaturase/sphingolipid hydroxylase (fatty acid hydroxylase superfamily)
MNTSKSAIAAGKYWKRFESVVFIIAAPVLIFVAASYFLGNVWASLNGEGIAGVLMETLQTGNYAGGFSSIVLFAGSFFLLLEVIKLIVAGWSSTRTPLNVEAMAPATHGTSRFSALGQKILTSYKSNALAVVFYAVMSNVLAVSVFVLWMPYFNTFSLFETGTQWYWWIYTVLVWELSYWAWHFAAHRVRLFWCLHSPHHAPSDMNMTVVFQVLFAQNYFSAIVQLPILMLLGVNPVMLLIIMAINDSWGVILHAGERAFKNGRLGILQYFIITPSHHRVHHAKNPLYIDTNFCLMLQFWDWLFGTLQYEREEVKIEYGITRNPDVTSFVDVQFGECIALYKDVCNATGLGNKFLYLIKPPGWTPEGNQGTAVFVRGQFLKQHPEYVQSFALRKQELSG